MRGLSELIGSWKTIWMFLRASRRCAVFIFAASWPQMTMRESGSGSRFIISSSVVVLPEPDSPTIAMHSPARTSKEMFLTAWTVPMRRLTSAPLVRGNSRCRFSTSSVISRSSRGMPAYLFSGSFGAGKSGLPLILPSTISSRRMQATRCSSSSPLSGISAGSLARHSSTAMGQRGANWQRSATSISIGGLPSMYVSGSVDGWSTRGVEPRRPTEYGIFGLPNSSCTSARSTGRPPYITSTSSAVPATTPMSWVIMMQAAPVSRWAFLITSRICAWMVTSSAVVGSSAMSTFGLFAIAIAMTTRWRMPPENSCGKERRRFFGSGMPTRSSSSAARSIALDLEMLLCAWIASTSWVPMS